MSVSIHLYLFSFDAIPIGSAVSSTRLSLSTVATSTIGNSRSAATEEGKKEKTISWQSIPIFCATASTSSSRLFQIGHPVNDTRCLRFDFKNKKDDQQDWQPQPNRRQPPHGRLARTNER